MFDRRLLLNFDFFLIALVVLVAACGVLNLYSISAAALKSPSGYFYKQIYWTVLGLLAVFFIISINYINLVRYAYYLHLFSMILMVVVILIGKLTLGSQRWLALGPVSVQPSELSKITFVLALTKFFTEDPSLVPYRLRDMAVPLSFFVITFLLIFIQPDLGTAGIIVLIFLSLFMFIRINVKSLGLMGAVAIVFAPLSWFLLKDYQKRRLLMFFNPELDPLRAGYQIIQSKIAVGSGALFGKGFTLGTQSQLRFLPEQHTDFAFSVWAEEWGFLGSLFLLSLFFILLYRGLRIAYNSRNFSGSFLAISIVITFFWQIVINLGMTIGIFPVVGVPLPFFSYGGSSMLSNLFGIGLLLNIGMRKFQY